MFEPILAHGEKRSASPSYDKAEGGSLHPTRSLGNASSLAECADLAPRFVRGVRGPAAGHSFHPDLEEEVPTSIPLPSGATSWTCSDQPT